MTPCQGRHGFTISAADGTDYCEDCGAVAGHGEPLPKTPWWRRLRYWIADKWFEFRHPDCPF